MRGGLMSKSSNQKLKLFYLFKIFIENTDAEHTLTVPEMIKELNKYGINAERKSIYDDIESLRKFGIDILCNKSKTYDYLEIINYTIWMTLKSSQRFTTNQVVKLLLI